MKNMKTRRVNKLGLALKGWKKIIYDFKQFSEVRNVGFPVRRPSLFCLRGD